MRETNGAGWRCRGGGVAALALALALLAPALARGARLVDVRVGTHPGYARVVLETDAPAAFEVIERGEDGAVLVRIAATSAVRRIEPRGAGAPSVEIEPAADGATLARIRAAGPLRVETQVLAAPPRVVLDLRPGERVAAAPEPASAREQPVAPEQAVEPEAPVAPAPEAAPEAPIPAQTEAPAPVAVEAPAEPEPSPRIDPTPEAVVSAPPPDARPAEAQPARPPIGPLPPVDAPPPAALALEPRSLATGLALGVALALFAFAARRPTRSREVAAEPAPEIGTPSAPEAAEEAIPRPAETAAAAEGAAAPIDADLADDLVRMHRRLDARVAALGERLDAVAAQHERLRDTSAAQALEISSQRAAIARLRAALRPSGSARGREESTPATRVR